MMGERNKYKALLFHHFAANGGNMQSKMALAYSYKRHAVSERPGVLLFFFFLKSEFILFKLIQPIESFTF